ncbi:MAG TPA: hypothetical protein VN643_07675 [Pyrinomonadaceae bacterium]|nr:hypothetical protein [Pyrinomonadaceae bacterium]
MLHHKNSLPIVQIDPRGHGLGGHENTVIYKPLFNEIDAVRTDPWFVKGSDGRASGQPHKPGGGTVMGEQRRT